MILLSLAGYVWRRAALRRAVTLCLGLVALAATARGQSWTDQDIGAVGVPGSTNEFIAGTFHLQASGADIWDGADSFRFRHRQWTGDGELIVRIHDVEINHVWTKLGLMFRESLAPNARHAFALLSGAGVTAHYRAETGGPTFMPVNPIGPRMGPAWLRLVRSGNTFTTYWSGDGTFWELVGSMSVNLPSTVYAGVAFTSHNNSYAASATVEAIRVQAPGTPFPAAIPPAAPTNLEARAVGSRYIVVQWTDQADTEIAFEIEASTNNVNWVQVNSTGRNQPGLGHSNLQAGTTYYYRVRARNNGGHSAYSAVASATTNAAPVAPNPPTNLVATAASATRIDLAWTDNSADETSFEIQRSTDGLMYGLLDYVQNTGPTYADTTVTAGTTYYYRVRARNVDGESAFSNVASATPGNAAPPAAPSNFRARSSADNSRIELLWDDQATNETGFEIERATGGGAFSSLMSAPADGSLALDTTAQPGVTYGYRIRAVNGWGSSAWSATVTHTLPGPGGSDGWTSSDIGAVGAAGSSSVANGRVTVTGSGTDIWEWSDEFHFRHQTLTGDGEIVAYVRQVDAVHGWSKAGVMLRENLTGNARNVFMFTAVNGTAMQVRASTDTALTWGATPGGAAAPPRWLRIRRVGNTFTTYEGSNPFDWQVVATVQLALPATIYAGLAVTSHQDGTLCGAQFDNVSLTPAGQTSNTPPASPSALAASAVSSSQVNLSWADNSGNETGFQVHRSTGGGSPTLVATTAANVVGYSDTGLAANTAYLYTVRAINVAGESGPSNSASVTTPSDTPPANPPAGPWQFGDIGNTGITGSNTSSGNTITIRGAGADIWDRADAFRFVYRTLTGDGMVEAQVSSITNTHGWAKAGVMIRASTDANAANVFAFATPTWQGLGAQVRPTTGAETTHQYGPQLNAPTWLRLQRTGNTFTASSSTDGVTWTPFATHTVAAGATAYFGFAVTAHDATQLNTATFTDPFIE